MGVDIGFQNNARYWKLVHIKVTNWWYQRYLNGLAVMFFLPRFFLAWYFKCPELTQPLSHDSSKNQTAYQKDLVEQNLAQLFIWTGIHCFVSSVNWFRLCKTKYVTDVSGTDEIFALVWWRHLHWFLIWPKSGATCINAKFGHQVAPLVFIPNFQTSQSNFWIYNIVLQHQHHIYR